MKIFDMMHVVRSEYEGIEVTEEMYVKLDEMLTEYGVDHAFRLPKPNEFDDSENAEMVCMYLEDDDTAYDLVFLLWTHKVVGMSDGKIGKAAAKVFVKKVL